MKQIIYIFIGIAFAGCNNFLDVKPDSTLAIPSELTDLLALVDNPTMMNALAPCELGEIGGDNYFIDQSRWQLLNYPLEKNGYIWADEVYQKDPVMDWVYGYSKILYSNTVLDGLDKIKKTDNNANLFNLVEGTALFYRAYNHYLLSQLFAPPYAESMADSQLGIPLKLSLKLEDKIERATNAEVYNQIVADLKNALEKLPEKPEVPQRPSKAAASYLLSRVHLQMGDYENALQYAQSSLNIFSDIIDYAQLDAELRYPFPGDFKQNKEMIFHGKMTAKTIFTESRLQIAPDLIDLYSANDYRRGLFFFNNGGQITFKGSYQGSSDFFTGFTTTEMYLTAAECLQRLGKDKEAQELLNHFLSFRIKDYESQNLSGQTLIQNILDERRKELIFRGVRWEDLRRLNQEKVFETTIKRYLGEDVYSLPPNDNRYVWPIPDDVILLSEIEQNPR